MSNENQAAEAVENTPVEPAGQGETETRDDAKTPEFYEKELERARKDAAKYRERAREVATETENKMREEFAHREAELQERIDEITAQHEDALFKANDSERSATKLRLALEHGIPKDKVTQFTKRLHGETEEDLESDAKSLAELFNPSVTEDRSQGQALAAPLNSPTLLRGLQDAANRRR